MKTKILMAALVAAGFAVAMPLAMAADHSHDRAGGISAGAASAPSRAGQAAHGDRRVEHEHHRREFNDVSGCNSVFRNDPRTEEECGGE